MSSDYKELLDLLEKNKDIPGYEIEHFISKHKVVASKKTTHTYVIYWVYLMWKSRMGGVPIPRNQFFKQFKRYFKPASRDRVRRYYVTSTDFLLHPDELRKAKQECRDERKYYASVRANRRTAKQNLEQVKERARQMTKARLLKRKLFKERKSET